MEEALPKLMELQNVCLEIEQLQRERETVPESVAALRASRDEQRRNVSLAEQACKENEEARLRASRELEEQELNLDRFQKQLQIVTDNQSYSAALKEIDTAKTRISELENEVLLLMEKQTELEQRVKEEQKALDEAEKKLSEESKQFEATEVGLDERYERLTARQHALESSLPDQYLKMFHQIAESRQGKALAEAKDYVCQECYMSIRPQAYAEIMSANKLIRCESCHRILYRLNDSVQPSLS